MAAANSRNANNLVPGTANRRARRIEDLPVRPIQPPHRAGVRQEHDPAARTDALTAATSSPRAPGIRASRPSRRPDSPNDVNRGRPEQGLDGPPTQRAISTVSVVTSDPITRLALTNFIRLQPHLAVASEPQGADIVVAALARPNGAAMEQLRESADDGTLFVLIVEGAWHLDLHKALDYGVRAILFRADFEWERFEEALRHVLAGHGDLPAQLQGRLMEQVKRTHRDVLVPRGLTATGMTHREVDVLRFVSEGLELQDIGKRMGYSERTIKNVLYGVIRRLGLRNRTHAVSYAIRNGLI